MTTPFPPQIGLQTERLLLMPAQPALAPAWLEYFQRNRAHFAPTDPVHPPDFYTLPFTESALARMAAGAIAGEQVSFALVPRDASDRIIGTCRFTQIARGAFQSCMLGYGIDVDHQGQGLMTEALRTAIAHMFDARRLHRIQANHLPENQRSARVLQGLGFVREGLAPRYLFIAGAWRDHVLNALLNPRYDDAWLQ